MRQLNNVNINTKKYWDTAKFNVDFKNTLRQDTYLHLMKGLEGKRVIELGCGDSSFLAKASKKYKAHGLDFSQKRIDKLKRLFPKVKYTVGDATKTPFRDKQFDIVVAGEVIEHLEDPMALVKEMKRLAKRMIILSTPKLEFKDPEHLWEFEPIDLVNMFGQGEAWEVKSDLFKGRSYVFYQLVL